MAVKVRFAGGGRVDPPSSWGTPRRMGSPIRLERELTLGIRPRVAGELAQRVVRSVALGQA
jgi:hypothetical protein